MAVVHPVKYEDELKKNSDMKDEDVQMLKEWHKKQPHLPPMTDAELALFLHSNYYRIEPTKTTIDTFYTVRTHVPEFFAHRDPLGVKELRKSFQTITVQVLDKKTPDGYAILYGRLIDEDPANYVYNDGMKYLSMVVDLWQRKEGTTAGHIILFDMKSVVFGHAARLSPMGLKKYLYYLQEALPVRLKGFHFMNITPVMDVILNMMKPFMKKELLDMSEMDSMYSSIVILTTLHEHGVLPPAVYALSKYSTQGPVFIVITYFQGRLKLHTHTTLDTLSKFLPVDILPNEAGGKAGPIMELHAKSLKWIEANRDWFVEEERTKRVNESLRPGKGKSASDLFGVEGTFKKLEID